MECKPESERKGQKVETFWCLCFVINERIIRCYKDMHGYAMVCIFSLSDLCVVNTSSRNTHTRLAHLAKTEAPPRHARTGGSRSHERDDLSSSGELGPKRRDPRSALVSGRSTWR